MSTPLRVLLIEDSEDDAMLLLRELRHSSYKLIFERVDTAAAMNTALDQQTWDVIISDYSMPQFSAPAALMLLQEKKLDLPFIIVSGTIGENTAVVAMRAGAHDFILKGNLARLVPAIERELREAAERRQRNRTEEALRQSEECFRLMVESVKDYAIFMLDTGGHFVSWNIGAERILGYQEAEIIGQHFSCIFTPEDQQRGEDTNELWTAATAERAEDERWHIRKDGTSFWASGVVTPVRDQTGTLRGFSKVMRDDTERKQAQEQIKASLQEKEVLLKEIHHRVKNNMQVVCSLLNLQSGAIEDPQTLKLLQESQNRVASMALVHEQLYESENLAKIDFAEYTQNLAANLFSSYDVNSHIIALKIDVDNVFLGIDAAIPCGLIISELVSNSLKYAFLPSQSGEIRIELHSGNNNHLMLSISDNGVGFPQNLDWQNTDSLGLQIVTSLTEQLSGIIELERKMGTKFKITFPDTNGV